MRLADHAVRDETTGEGPGGAGPRAGRVGPLPAFDRPEAPQAEIRALIDGPDPGPPPA